MIRLSPLPLAQILYYAALLAMPLVGVGSVYLLMGVDSGAGFQPAYILLALAYGFLLLGGGVAGSSR